MKSMDKIFADIRNELSKKEIKEGQKKTSKGSFKRIFKRGDVCILRGMKKSDMLLVGWSTNKTDYSNKLFNGKEVTVNFEYADGETVCNTYGIRDSIFIPTKFLIKK